MRYAALLVIVTIILVSPHHVSLSQESVRPWVLACADSLATLRHLNEFALHPALDDSATMGELTTLSESQKSAVRYYALRALAAKEDPTVLTVLANHLSDTAHVVVGAGDVYGQGPLSWYVANKFLDTYLRRATPIEDQHRELRTLAQDSTVPVAVTGLARYRRPEDIPFLEKRIHQMLFLQAIPPGGQPDYGFYALTAVREFPAPQFFPILQRARKLNRQQGMLLQAVVVYKNQEASDFLTDYLRQPEGDDLWMAKMHVAVALIRYPDDRFYMIDKGLTLDLRSFQLAQMWARDPNLSWHR